MPKRVGEYAPVPAEMTAMPPFKVRITAKCNRCPSEAAYRVVHHENYQGDYCSDCADRKIKELTGPHIKGTV